MPHQRQPFTFGLRKIPLVILLIAIPFRVAAFNIEHTCTYVLTRQKNKIIAWRQLQEARSVVIHISAAPCSSTTFHLQPHGMS